MPGGSADLPGFSAGLHPRSSVRPSGLLRRLRGHPPPLHLHLYHVQGGGDAEAGQLSAKYVAVISPKGFTVLSLRVCVYVRERERVYGCGCGCG